MMPPEGSDHAARRNAGFSAAHQRILDHAEREHGTREIVAARADGTTVRTDWRGLARDAAASDKRSNGSG